ncbi:MAG: class I SAM-dependent methyltransferase [Mycobacteriaceae bacterium]
MSTTASPYETTTRPEIHELIPPSAKRFLDVGCNDGGFGRWLKHTQPSREVWGVEPNANQAAVAQRTYTDVLTGLYPDVLKDLGGEFDCIIFNHVLEHMVDPWGALLKTRDRLTDGGCVIAVIPNIRYVTVLADLAFRGRWDYQDAGLLDRTHLRFFTRASIEPLFGDAGFTVDRLLPVNAFGSVSHPALARATARAFGDIMFGGFAVRAVRR